MFDKYTIRSRTKHIFIFRLGLGIAPCARPIETCKKTKQGWLQSQTLSIEIPHRCLRNLYLLFSLRLSHIIIIIIIHTFKWCGGYCSPTLKSLWITNPQCISFSFFSLFVFCIFSFFFQLSPFSFLFFFNFPLLFFLHFF